MIGTSLSAGYPVALAGWMPGNGSLHGIAVDRLMRTDLVLLILCFLAAHLLLVAGILRWRKGHRRPTLFWMEALPLALLIGMYVWMAVTAQKLWAGNRFEGASPAAMQVEVVGVQFQWYFRYPGPDAAYGATRPERVNAAAGNPLGLDPEDPHAADDLVTSELVLPAGREVDLQLRAHDVIHGFFVPGMRMKQNAVPGMVLHVHFTPEQEGIYPIYCSQVCGLGHHRMQARLRVVGQSEFNHWLAERAARRKLGF